MDVEELYQRRGLAYYDGEYEDKFGTISWPLYSILKANSISLNPDWGETVGFLAIF